jgi:hypothetical protein
MYSNLYQKQIIMYSIYNRDTVIYQSMSLLFQQKYHHKLLVSRNKYRYSSSLYKSLIISQLYQLYIKFWFLIKQLLHFYLYSMCVRKIIMNLNNFLLLKFYFLLESVDFTCWQYMYGLNQHKKLWYLELSQHQDI